MQKKFPPTYCKGIGVAIIFFMGNKQKSAKIPCFFGHISVVKKDFKQYFILFLVTIDLLLQFLIDFLHIFTHLLITAIIL